MSDLLFCLTQSLQHVNLLNGSIVRHRNKASAAKGGSHLWQHVACSKERQLPADSEEHKKGLMIAVLRPKPALVLNEITKTQ